MRASQTRRCKPSASLVSAPETKVSCSGHGNNAQLSRIPSGAVGSTCCRHHWVEAQWQNLIERGLHGPAACSRNRSGAPLWQQQNASQGAARDAGVPGGRQGCATPPCVRFPICRFMVHAGASARYSGRHTSFHRQVVQPPRVLEQRQPRRCAPCLAHKKRRACALLRKLGASGCYSTLAPSAEA